MICSIENAVIRLRERTGSRVALMEAVNALRSNPAAPPAALLPALSLRGTVREQAMFALYELTGRKLPPSRQDLDYDADSWLAFLEKRGAALKAMSDELHSLRELGVDVDLPSLAESAAAR